MQKLTYLVEKLLYVYGGKQKCREENNDGEKQSFSVMEIVLGMKTRREKKNQVENNKLRREKLKEGMQKWNKKSTEETKRFLEET